MFTNLPYLSAFVPYNIVPISELYAWSNNQKIHILFHKITELVKATNDYDKIFEEIKRLLDDFDDEMKNKLEELLERMYEDGSLKDLVAEIAEEYFSSIPLNTELNFKRVHRGLYMTGDNDRYYSDAVRPCYMQGGTYVKGYEGIDYYVYCLVPWGARNIDYQSNAGVIIAYRVDTNYCAGAVAVQMDHMNSIDYNPYDRNLYIAGTNHYTSTSDDSSVPSTELFRISMEEIVGGTKGGLNASLVNNFDTHAMCDLLKLSDNGIAYQPTYYDRDLTLSNGNNIYDWSANDHCNNISYSNNLPANNIYVGTKRGLVFQYDWNTNTIIKEICGTALNTILSRGDFSGGIHQCGIVHNNYYYDINHYPDCIIRCNINTQKVEYVYTLPQILENGYWERGETEDIKILDNGDIYLFTTVTCFQKPYTQFIMPQIFKSNIFNNMRIDAIPRDKGPTTVFVNRFSEGNNPNGNLNGNFDGQNREFKTIFEAVLWANTTEIADSINIYLRTNSTFGVVITSPKKILIRPSVYTTVNRNILEYDETIPTSAWGNGVPRKCAIGGVYCNGAGNTSLFMLGMHNSYIDNKSPYQSYLYISESSVNCSNLFFIHNHANIKTAIRCQYGTLVISGNNSNTTGNFTVQDGKTIEVTVDGVVWTYGYNWLHNDDEAVFINATNSIVNAHRYNNINTNVIA